MVLRTLLGTTSVLALVWVCGCGGGEGAPASSPSGGAPGAGSASPPSDTQALDDSAPAGAPSADTAAGNKAFDAGNFADARKSFEAAVKKNPKDFAAYQNLAVTCEKLGDKVAAEVAYKHALEIRPDLDTAAGGLSALYIDQGRIDEALAVARNGLAKHPGSAALHENMGVALAARGDQDNATKEFSAAVQAAPADPMMHLTFAHWLNVWKVRGAAPHLDAARSAVKDDVGMLASIGLEYRYAGEFDSCVKTLDRAITLKDGGEVRTERALCKLGLKDEKGTLDDLQAAVAKDPSYAPGHYYLGGRLAKQKHFKEAASEYAKYLELEPNGSLAGQASERLKASQDAMGKDGGKDKGGASAAAPKKK
jgi:tetratricopeptide (TPR) repeat protein